MADTRGSSTEKLLAQRIVMLGSPIDDDVAQVVIAQLLFLHHEAPDRPITLWLRTPGGLVGSALAIYDTVCDLGCPVHTLALGEVAGVALLVLAAGERGQRAAVADARLRFTPITSTVPVVTAEMEHARHTVERLFAEMTGKPETIIAADLHAGRVLTADEARAYGLVDVIAR